MVVVSTATLVIHSFALMAMFMKIATFVCLCSLFAPRPSCEHMKGVWTFLYCSADAVYFFSMQ